MKAKKKIIILIIAVVTIILVGAAGFVFKSFKSGTTLTHETPTGTRAINLPSIPGMEKTSEEKGECFQKTTYAYTLTRMDITSQLRDQIKSAFASRGWQLEQEAEEVLSFTTSEQGELEKLILKLGYEEGRGTTLSFEYQWPPCSEEEVKGIQTVNNDWPMFHGNLARTGYSDSPAPAKPNVLWQITVGKLRELGVDNFEPHNPIIKDGRIFFPGDRVYCLDLSTGEIVWSYRDEQNPQFFPGGTAAGEGKVFVAVNDSGLIKNMRTGFIYALDAGSGNFLWKTQIAGAPSHSLPLVAENRVFTGDDSGTLNALDAATGKILWQKKLVGDGVIHSSPAYANGLVFVGTEGDARYHEHPPHPSSMFALSLSRGEVVWQFPIDYTQGGTNLIHATPAISDSVVYFGSENGYFYALKTSDGQLIWKKQVAVGGMMVGTSAAAGLGYGKVFVGLWSGKFVALDQRTGETVWEFPYEGQGTDSSPVVALSPSKGDGKVCLGAHEGYFYCLNAETGKVLWKEKLGGPSAALANGILVVPNALAGENLRNETPVILAFSDEGRTALDLPEAELPESKLYLLLIGAGIGVLVLCGILFLKSRKR